MTFNALKEKGLSLEKQLRNWHLIVREPYNKTEVDCYSRTRQIYPCASLAEITNRDVLLYRTPTIREFLPYTG